MKKAVIQSPLGGIEIKGDEHGLCSIEFIENDSSTDDIPYELKDAVTQLKDYFNGERTHFDLKLALIGSDFQKKVWKLLKTIPYGKTWTYQEVANKLGNPKVIRAAASANGKNPLAIVVPCHRVIGSDGSLTGYAGGLGKKKWLLDHESPFTQGRLF